MDFAQLIQTVAIYALPVLFAITIHEAAHGYAARHFGDNTAWNLGRVTLNPSKHIDPIGTIAMPLLLYFATGGSFLFGYAKPVPVRFGNLRNPKRDMIWVALAGPAANLIQALLWGILFYLLQIANVEEPFFYGMCKAGVSMNLGLFVFNLFPLPPLDGGRIMVGLLPMRQALAFSRIEPYGFFIVIALIYMRVLDALWMRPLLAISNAALNIILTPFAMLAN
jgi:Zn-dependent protease